MKSIKFLFLLLLIITTSCDKKENNNFTYTEFKDALYYNKSSGSFSELGNFEMCVNRWGEPARWVTSMGTMSDRYGSNSKLNTIVFEWTNIHVNGKNVEIHFVPDNSGITIEGAFTNNSIHPNYSKHFIVKEFRLTQ